MEERLKSIDHFEYVSADLQDGRAMIKMDLTDIQFPENSFDVIYCSHVLEHITDDRKAMRELFRVLASGGWMVIQVPLFEGPTFEDPKVTDPEDRKRLFGQSDHVRKYGKDILNRLEGAGFTTQALDSVQILGRYRCKRMNAGGRAVLHCTKP